MVNYAGGTGSPLLLPVDKPKEPSACQALSKVLSRQRQTQQVRTPPPPDPVTRILTRKAGHEQQVMNRAYVSPTGSQC